MIHKYNIAQNASRVKYIIMESFVVKDGGTRKDGRGT